MDEKEPLLRRTNVQQEDAPPESVGHAVTSGPSFAARNVLCACESRLPNLVYLLSATHVLQTHLSRPMRALHLVFRAPHDGRLVLMAKLGTHHLVVIAAPSPSRLLRLVFLRERSSLLSCFGFVLNLESWNSGALL